MNSFAAELLTKAEIAPGVLFLTFRADKTLDFKPGQFVTMLFGKKKRLYSIASVPDASGEFELIVKLLPTGVASSYFEETKGGDKIQCKGIGGIFTLRDNLNPKIFLATGVGIAPIRSMIINLVNQKYSKPFVLFWGLRTKADIYLYDEFEKLSRRNKNFDFYYCLSRENVNDKHLKSGHIQECLKDDFADSGSDNANAEYYLCGGLPVVQSLREFLQNELHVSKDSIFEERFV